MSISNYHRTVDEMRYAGIKPTPGKRVSDAALVCAGAKPSAKPAQRSVRVIVKRGSRYFAVTRVQSFTDRVTASRIKGNWQDLPSTSTRARVVRNFS